MKVPTSFLKSYIARNSGRKSSDWGSGPYDTSQTDYWKGLLQQYGQAPKQEPKKMSFLERLGELVSTTETAPAVYSALRGKSPVKAYGSSVKQGLTSPFTGKKTTDRKTYEDVLGQLGWRPSKYDKIGSGLRKVAGFGLDVALDPLTYVSFGDGAGAKIGGKTLTRAGTKYLSKAGAKVGREAAERSLLEIAEKGGKEAAQYFAKDGLKFMGMEILPRKVVTAPARGVDKLLSKSKIYKGAKDTLGKAFVPFYDLKKMGPKGKFYAEKMSSAPKKMRAAMQSGVDDLLEHYKTYGKDLGDALKSVDTHLVKKTVPKNPKLAKVVSHFENLYKTLDEAELGKVRVKSLKGAGYSPRVLSEAGEEFISGSKALPNVTKMSPRKLKASKSRQLYTFTDEAGNKIVGKPDKLGLIEITPNKIKQAKKQSSDVGKGQMFPLSQKEKSVMDKAVETQARKESQFGIFTDEQGNIYTKGTATISEINDKMRPLLGGKDFFETNPYIAAAKRMIDSQRALSTQSLAADTLKETGVFIKPELQQIKDPITGKLVQTQALRQPQVIDGIKMVPVEGIPGFQNWLAPEPIVKALQETKSLMASDEALGSFLKFYDKVLNFWKGSVTGWFPSFHLRNVMGATFNNWISGVKSMRPYVLSEKIQKGAEGTLKTARGELKYSDILKNMKESFMDQPGIIDVKAAMTPTAAVKTKKGLNYLPRKAMEAVENRVRGGLYVDRLIKGDSYDEAARAVFATHFDYMPEGLTWFERNVIKRLIPFYRWTRGNIPFQIANLVKQPGKYSATFKALRSMSDKEAESESREYTDDWLAEMLGFYTKDKTGTPRKVRVNLPLEDLGKMGDVKEWWSMLAPGIKAPVELLTNRNVYFGSDIVDKDLPKSAQTVKAYESMKYMPDPLKKLLGIEEVSKTDSRTGRKTPQVRGNALAMYLMRNLTPLSRLYSETGKLTDPERNRAEKLLNALSGIKSYPIDVEEKKFWDDFQEEKDIEKLINYLRRYNKIPSYEAEKAKWKGKTNKKPGKRGQY